MAKPKPAANPINPRGIPRGVAKPDAFRLLKHLDKLGLHEVEREEIEAVLGYRIGADPSDLIIARALELEAEFYEWMCEEPEERVEKLGAARNAGQIDDERHDALLAQVWDDEKCDRRRVAALFLDLERAASGLPDDKADLLRRLDGGEDVELSDDLEQEADRYLRRERKRWRKRDFARQLGKLPAQSPREQQLTIADWRRNCRKRGPANPIL